MNLDELLSQYIREEGIESLKPDEGGIYRLLVNDTIVISFEPSLDEKGFFIYAAVGSIPQEEKNEIALMCLNGNLFGNETGEASLGYSSELHLIVLFQHLEQFNMDYARFRDKLKKFIFCLIHWIEKLQQVSAYSSESDEKLKHMQELMSHGKLQIFFA